MTLSIFVQKYDGDKIDFNLIKNKITDIYISENYLKEPNKAYNLLKNCEKHNIKPHAWVFCFKKGDTWLDPADHITQDTIIQRIVNLIPIGIKGIVLDYVRYPGTAYKHKGAENHITTFIARVKTTLPKTIELSACVMPEMQANTQLYGQNYKLLTKHATLIPMAYKGNYKQTTKWIQNVCTYIRKQIATGKLICSILTYKSDDKPEKLTKQEIEQDINSALKGGANGVALFHYPTTTKDFFTTKNR